MIVYFSIPHLPIFNHLADSVLCALSTTARAVHLLASSIELDDCLARIDAVMNVSCGVEVEVEVDGWEGTGMEWIGGLNQSSSNQHLACLLRRCSRIRNSCCS